MADLDSKDKDKIGNPPGSSEMGLQERKIEADAWAGIAAGLQEVESALARASSASGSNQTGFEHSASER